MLQELLRAVQYTGLLLGSQGLRSEIIDAVSKTTLYKRRVKPEKVLHLLALDYLGKLLLLSGVKLIHSASETFKVDY